MDTYLKPREACCFLLLGLLLLQLLCLYCMDSCIAPFALYAAPVPFEAIGGKHQKPAKSVVAPLAYPYAGDHQVSPFLWVLLLVSLRLRASQHRGRVVMVA